MGGGSWTKDAYCSYTSTVRGCSVDSFKSASYSSAGQVYKSHRLDAALNPKNVMRECCDSEEHPNSKPVILALDVTGSMGGTAISIAKTLDEIIEESFEKFTDVEFLTMGIGDLAYDSAPIQASQFESDIRIADQLDKIYFEAGGGGNDYESYTAAWYFGIHNCKLDCWNRGEKGLIITMGDEPCNPYLPHTTLNAALGSTEQRDVNTKELVQEASIKYDLYHICVTSTNAGAYYGDRLKSSYAKYLPEDHIIESSENEVKAAILNIIEKKYGENAQTSTSSLNANGELVW